MSQHIVAEVNNYETTFIVRQDLSQADAEKIGQDFQTIVIEQGGKIAKSEYWGLRNLSYIMKKNKKGHYIHFAHTTSSSGLKELQRKMSLNENVLREVSFKVEEISKEVSPIMAAKE